MPMEAYKNQRPGRGYAAATLRTEQIHLNHQALSLSRCKDPTHAELYGDRGANQIEIVLLPHPRMGALKLTKGKGSNARVLSAKGFWAWFGLRPEELGAYRVYPRDGGGLRIDLTTAKMSDSSATK